MSEVELATFKPKAPQPKATEDKASAITGALTEWLLKPNSRPMLLTVNVKADKGSFRVKMRNGTFTVTALPEGKI